MKVGSTDISGLIVERHSALASSDSEIIITEQPCFSPNDFLKAPIQLWRAKKRQIITTKKKYWTPLSRFWFFLKQRWKKHAEYFGFTISFLLIFSKVSKAFKAFYVETESSNFQHPLVKKEKLNYFCLASLRAEMKYIPTLSFLIFFAILFILWKPNLTLKWNLSHPISANCIHTKVMFVHVSDREVCCHQFVTILP